MRQLYRYPEPLATLDIQVVPHVPKGNDPLQEFMTPSRNLTKSFRYLNGGFPEPYKAVLGVGFSLT